MNIELLDINNENQLNNVDEIFFSTSSKKEFISAKEKEEFRAKYLGHYIQKYNKYFYVALEHGSVIGYLCCCPDTLSDDYFLETFGYYQNLEPKKLLRFNAHLHINLSEQSRGKGIGSKLIKNICNRLHADNVEGVHIFTTPDSENVSFYKRNYFCDELSVQYHDIPLLFLGRKISIAKQ